MPKNETCVTSDKVSPQVINLAVCTIGNESTWNLQVEGGHFDQFLQPKLPNKLSFEMSEFRDVQMPEPNNVLSLESSLFVFHTVFAFDSQKHNFWISHD